MACEPDLARGRVVYASHCRNLAFLLQGLLGGPSSRDLIARLPAALPWFVFAPLMEEIGWRGFLQPRLMEKYKTWIASILVGIAWGIWHLPLNAIGFRQYGSLALLSIALQAIWFSGWAILPLVVDMLLLWAVFSQHMTVGSLRG